MTESLMQKDPTWREGGGRVCSGEREGTLGVLSAPPPLLQKHICLLLFLLTHPFPLVLTRPPGPVREAWACSGPGTVPEPGCIGTLPGAELPLFPL